MTIDSSAVLCVFFREAPHERVLNRMVEARTVLIGAPALVELGTVLTSDTPLPAYRITEFLYELEITVVPFGSDHWLEAVRAFEKFVTDPDTAERAPTAGRVRERSQLRFQDCLSYAVAKVAAHPLLTTNPAFARTDLDLVPY